MHVVKIEGGQDARSQIELGLQAGPKGGSALTIRDIRFFNSITSAPAHRNASPGCIIDHRLEVGAGPIAIVIVGTQLDSAAK